MQQIQEKLIKIQKEVNAKWNQLKEIKDQKVFAKEVIDFDGKSLLFLTKKYNEVSETPLNEVPKEVWLKSVTFILEQVTGQKTGKKMKKKDDAKTNKKKKNPVKLSE